MFVRRTFKHTAAKWHLAFLATIVAVGAGVTSVAGMTAPAQAASFTAQLSETRLNTASVAAVSVQSTAQSSCQGTYTVKPGDWLSSIAARYGLTWQQLAAANGITNPNLIMPGQQLALCSSGSAPAQSGGIQSAAMVSTSSTYSASGEPCRSTVYATGAISQWTVPPGCYAGIYNVNPANYVARSGFGWCNWWPEVLHPNNPNILNMPRSSNPSVGAAVYFAPGVQGASSAGHYAQVVAIVGGGWVLISEMNDSWRGGGWEKVNYRYIHTGAGVYFMAG